jgi:hypothetical protein
MPIHTGEGDSMNMAHNIGKAAAGGGLLIAACAACCAPLIAPWVVAIFAAGGTGLALAGQVGIAVLIAAAGGLYFWSRHRGQSRKAATSVSGCGCAPEAGGSTEPAPIIPDAINP